MKLRMQIDKTQFVEYETKMAPEDFKTFISGFLEWQCEKIRERIREVVKRQSYSWSSLSPAYVQFKRRMGLSPKIWLASGQVLGSIIYRHEMLGNQWIIGVHPTLRHRAYIKGGGLDWSRKGAKIIDIIRWLDGGTQKMPSRPLFTKVFQEFKPKKVQTKLYAEYIKTQKGLI